MLKKTDKIFSILAMIILTCSLFFVQNVRAATTEMTASCTNNNGGSGDPETCNVYNDIKIDGSKVEKVELMSATFDDSGEIIITSPSGKTNMIPSIGTGCLQSHGYEDVTELFTEAGMYTVHVNPKNDCGDEISSYAYFTVTYEDPLCQREGSLECNTPGPCETLPGKCVVVGEAETCKYAPDNSLCTTAPSNSCLTLPGKCVAVGGEEVCQYTVSNESCDVDGNSCTYDTCISNDNGTSASCKAGPNLCSGLIPCGRLADNPSTPNINETDPCGACSVIILASNIINFLVGIMALLTVLAIVSGGFLYVWSAGNVNLVAAAKQNFGKIIQGFAIVFCAWLIINLLMILFGFSDPLGDGAWMKFECNF